MGLTLDHNGISIADAESGKVTRTPNVPSILPRPEEKQPPK